MHKTSTQTPTNNCKSSSRTMSPSKKTIAVIRQFARIYMPVNAMPGVVLN